MRRPGFVTDLKWAWRRLCWRIRRTLDRLADAWDAWKALNLCAPDPGDAAANNYSSARVAALPSRVRTAGLHPNRDVHYLGNRRFKTRDGWAVWGIDLTRSAEHDAQAASCYLDSLGIQVKEEEAA